MQQIYPFKTIHPLNKNLRISLLLLLVVSFSFTASSQVISFKNFTLESGTGLTQGAVYRFTNVCSPGNVDALVTVTELYRMELKHIDSMFTGTDDGFQPTVSSTGGKGDHYAIFNIVFVTGGTIVPLSIVDFTGTFYDLNGNNQINEYTSTTIENAGWEYSNSNPAISVTQTGNIITGVSENTDLGQGIDTANTSNSFVVSTPDVSSFTVKFGFIQDVTGWNGNDQFSLLFSGRSSAVLMPVRLQSFNAQLSGEKVHLKWTTSLENNFSHFVVERSLDGKKFNDVAIVFSNNGLNPNYQYTEDLNSKGIFYYRLKMVDITQKSQSSMIRIIKTVDESLNVNVQAYPNPVVNELRVSVPSTWQNKPVTYALYSSDGSLIRRAVNTGNQTEVIPMSSLNPGIYIVKVSSGNETAVKQIMKSK